MLRCPDHILAMFDGDEATKCEARKLAIDWLRTKVGRMRIGDKVLMPDPETGVLFELEKTATGLN